MNRVYGRDGVSSSSSIRTIWAAAIFWVVALSALTGAQNIAVRFPPRDSAPPPHRDERRVPIGTASISGTVTASDTGLPFADARVTLTGTAQCITPAGSSAPGADDAWLVRSVVTDSSGHFSFSRLPAGAFRINVDPEDDHYFETNYGETRNGGEGRHIPLTDGQRVAIHVPLVRGSVITGMVLGPNGIPVRKVSVGVFQNDFSKGIRRLKKVHDVDTDDRGVYRASGLTPGTYLVGAFPDASTWSRKLRDRDADHLERTILAASVSQPPAFGRPAMITVPNAPSSEIPDDRIPYYLPTYAPSSLRPSTAMMITVGPNEDRHGVDIYAHMIRASTIHGALATPLSDQVSANVVLVNDDAYAVSSSVQTTRVDRDGEFMFDGVEPGNYTLFVETFVSTPRMTLVEGHWRVNPLPDVQKMWGQTSVTVGGEPLVRVSLPLHPARSISGIVVFETQSRPDLIKESRVFARHAKTGHDINFPGGSLSASVGSDGRFTITGVPAGRYILDFSHTLKSAVVSGQDTLDFPLAFSGSHDITNAVLTFSDRATELRGTLMDATGKPALDHVVIAAASDSRYWHPDTRRVERSFLDPGGRFAFENLPAGQYQLSVVRDLEPGALFDPEFLRMIARTSVTVTIPDGGKVTQHLRVK